MGWNPSINFSLRDDEITFGELIMDKNTAELLARALMLIKNGQPVDNFPQILQYVYTDQEFSCVKLEFKEIVEDIKYFGDLLKARGKFSKPWEMVGARAESSFMYVVGSQSWIQKYISYKQMGADMYGDLIADGFIFPADEASKYSARYGFVLESTTRRERATARINEQFNQDIIDLGWEQAIANKMEAEQAAGITSEGTISMMKSIGASVAQAKAEGAAENEAMHEELELQQAQVADDIQQIMQEEENNVVLTTDDILEVYQVVNDECKDWTDRGNRMQKLYGILLDVRDRAGIELRSEVIELAHAWINKEFSEEASNAIAEAVKQLIGEISMSVYKSLVDSIKYSIDKNVWRKIIPAPRNVINIEEARSAREAEEVPIHEVLPGDVIM